MRAYDVAVKEANENLCRLLQPMITKDGSDITGIQYSTNNPKHPAFRPESRQALLSLFAMESRLSR
jgi:hypothetical protein